MASFRGTCKSIPKRSRYGKREIAFLTVLSRRFHLADCFFPFPACRFAERPSPCQPGSPGRETRRARRPPSSACRRAYVCRARTCPSFPSSGSSTPRGTCARPPARWETPRPRGQSRGTPPSRGSPAAPGSALFGALPWFAEKLWLMNRSCRTCKQGPNANRPAAFLKAGKGFQESTLMTLVRDVSPFPRLCKHRVRPVYAFPRVCARSHFAAITW